MQLRCARPSGQSEQTAADRSLLSDVGRVDACAVTGARRRILVADDDPAICSVLSRVLREHEVVCVPDGRAALDRVIAGERFDVIVCDLEMPRMGGVLVYWELAVLAPDQACRMLFLSGGATKRGDVDFLEQVAPRRLDKPFALDELRAAVDAILVAHDDPQ